MLNPAVAAGISGYNRSPLRSRRRPEAPFLTIVDDSVRLAQTGDPDAFRRLYDQQVGRVYALCLRMSGDPVLAEELTQNVFVRAWERLASFRGESAFGTWLHRLAVNEVLTGFRSSRRRSERIVAREDLESLEEPGVFSSSPAAGLDLERAIARLPAGARAVFVLHDIEGYAHEEISAMTGVATGTSKAQLHRARRLLRGALQ